MKPPIEYRPSLTKPKSVDKSAKTPRAAQEPPPKAGGRWVWVPDGKKITLRSATRSTEYMRDYMRKRRAEAKP